MNCAVYARISTRDKGQDVDNQLNQMREWAAREGHVIVAEYIDNVSGSGKVKRPAFERMMLSAEGKIGDDKPGSAKLVTWTMLLFWSLDRLSREGVYQTLTHLKRLDEAGVCWRSHTEAYLDSCGVFREAVLAILAAIAKQERLRISERVKAGLDTARAAGRVGGRPRVAVDEEMLERARRLRGEGLTVMQVAMELGVSKSRAGRMVVNSGT